MAKDRSEAPGAVNWWTSLEGRLPFAWLRERDIDLLFCSELHAKGDVAKLLAAKLGDPSAAFENAWVSVAEQEGQSDLVVVLSGATGRLVALIEDKIGAVFQPGQAARYRARAARWIKAGARVVTVLVAPAEYLLRAGSQDFEATISYEEIEATARNSGDLRSVFFANALLGGVKAYHRGYDPEPDAAVSDVWSACWKWSQEMTPKLNFRSPGLKPGRAMWFRFTEAEGFQPGEPARLIYKANRGQADLQFRRTNVAQLRARVGALLERDMQVVRATKSASVRLAVPKIDFSGAPKPQQMAILAGLKACERLRALYVERIRG